MTGSNFQRPLLVFRALVYLSVVFGAVVFIHSTEHPHPSTNVRAGFVGAAYMVFLLLCYVSPQTKRTSRVTFQALGLTLAEALLACVLVWFLGGPTGQLMGVCLLAPLLCSVQHNWQLGLTASGVSTAFILWAYPVDLTSLTTIFLGFCCPALTSALDLQARIRKEAKTDEDLDEIDEAYSIAKREATRRQANEEELYKERRRFEGLVSIAHGLADERDQERLLQRMTEIAADQLSSRGAVVFLVKEDKLAAHSMTGLTGPMLSTLERCVDIELIETLSQTQAPLTWDHKRISEINPAHKTQLEKFRILLDPTQKRPAAVNVVSQMIGVPLSSAQDSRAFGLILVLNHSLDRGYTKAEGRYLQVLSTNAATALKNILFTLELERSHWELIQALAQAIEAKDSYTSNHIQRVRDLSVQIARCIGLDRETSKVIAIAATLHDVGKISTPDLILGKPGPLTDDEYDIMKQHAENGAQILRGIRSLPDGVEDMVRHHHEHWNGGGYPAGIKGAEIPLGAQIISIADCFDAMTYDRPYRKGFEKNVALEKMERGCGSQFNPKLLCALFAIQGYVPQENTLAIETYNSIIGRFNLGGQFADADVDSHGIPRKSTGASGRGSEHRASPLLLERN